MIPKSTAEKHAKLRVGLFLALRESGTLGSVAVRFDEAGGEYFMDVAVTGEMLVPSSYGGLPVRVRIVPPVIGISTRPIYNLPGT